MKQIYLLKDYKGFFGSKQKSEAYRSGMNLELLERYFMEYEFSVNFIHFDEVDVKTDKYKNQYVLYTSSEDVRYYYKDYIEDIIYALELKGAKVIPRFKFLRANNNKVFMELMRDILYPSSSLQSKNYGTLESLLRNLHQIQYPVVLKTAKGAMSKGVFLARNEMELIKYAKKIASTRNWWKELWDIKNAIKHRGKFTFNSKYRNKFIVQKFIPSFKNDWKVLVYGNKIFTLKRNFRENDFRASGSGLFEFEEQVPQSMLEYAFQCQKVLDLPHISLDIGYDGNEYILIEFQALYFGTKTLEWSPHYFERINEDWQIIRESTVLEKVYVESICEYIKQKNG